MTRVYIDIESLSVEDVNGDATEIFGSFGAEHVEPEAVTPLELQVASCWEGRMTSQNREILNRWGN